jgi:hypothetical protein
MKQKLIISLWILVVALAIVIIAMIPTIKKWYKINELQALQDRRAECEEFQKNSHLEAEAIRKQLGLDEALQPQVATGIEVSPLQAIDNLLNNTLSWQD